MVVLYHDDHRGEEKAHWKHDRDCKVDDEGEEQGVGGLGQAWTPEDVVECEVLLDRLAAVEELSADVAPPCPTEGTFQVVLLG